MAGVVEAHPFLVRRLHEWSLFRAIALAQPCATRTLPDPSDWLPRKIATSLDADAVLAERVSPADATTDSIGGHADAEP